MASIPVMWVTLITLGAKAIGLNPYCVGKSDEPINQKAGYVDERFLNLDQTR